MLRFVSRLAVLLAGTLAAAAQSPPAEPESAPEPAPPPAARADAPPQNAGGVVVHGAPAPAAAAREALPPGVTVVGGKPAPANGPLVRVIVEPGPRVPERLPLPQPQLPPVRLTLGPPSAPEGAQQLPEPGTIGPGAAAQQRAFGRPAAPAGGLPLPASSWTPNAAYEGDVNDPYPWNRATFTPPLFDAEWKGVPAWPPGQDLRDWSPAGWSAPPFDWTWTPTDSFGRNLGVNVEDGEEEEAAGEEDAGAAPQQRDEQPGPPAEDPD